MGQIKARKIVLHLGVQVRHLRQQGIERITLSDGDDTVDLLLQAIIVLHI